MSDTPRIAYFCPVWGRQGPFQLGWSDYWRLALPAIELHRNRWDVVLGRRISVGKDGRINVMDPDQHWWEDREILVFHRWMNKTAPGIIRRAREAGQILVNDVDDLLWNMPPDHPGHEQMNQPDYNLQNYCETLKASSLLTTSTARLAQEMEVFDRPVRLVRNYIDLSAWEPQPPGQYTGWVGSPAGRSEDLALLRPIVEQLTAQNESFYHGGVLPGEPKIADVLDNKNVITRPFQTPPTYPRLWDPLRIALCPLGEHPFSQAKSWVKPLEACARGIPFIASDHPEYRDLGVGRLAATPEEWTRQLNALQDPTVYAADCIINRRRAEELGIAQHVDKWEELFSAIQEERTVAL